MHDKGISESVFVLGRENRLVAFALGLLPESESVGEQTLPDQPAADTADEKGPEFGVQPKQPLRIATFPLTVYAPSGYGKTHLLHAIEALWFEQAEPSSCLMTNAADFARAYAKAVKLDDVARFQRHFQRVHLLMIDDLDTLRRKPGAQHQLSTILDHRTRQQRPTILTLQEEPHSARLDQRLVSRISRGLSVPVLRPDDETRVELARQLCQRRKVPLAPAAQEAIRQQTSLTVPQLLGWINQLCLSNSSENSSNAPPTASLPKVPTVKPVDPKQVIGLTASFFGVGTKNLTSKSRRKLDVLARSVAMYLIRQHTSLSFQQIGKLFGDRDHTTVMHACRKVEHDLSRDAGTRHALEDLKRRLIRTDHG